VALVPIGEGAAAVTYEGALHLVDGDGRLLHAFDLDRGYLHGLFGVETWKGDALLVHGPDVLEWIPLDGRVDDDWRARARASGAWDLLDRPDPVEEPRAALAWALATDAPIEPILAGRDDATAEILRSLTQ
jgi:hypothetical protein